MVKSALFKWLAPALLMAAIAANAVAADDVTVAYQTSVEPAKVAQADGLYEKSTGRSINWRKFESGAEVIAAVASGDVQLGYVGSSPLAAAASHGLPVQTFLIAVQIGSAEALVVRPGITRPQDLIGKKIAVPFVSTTHYSLLAALKHWQIDPTKVQIINLRPTEITAAWLRGDIDAAYVWDPALGKLRETGKELVTSTEVAKWGSPTFDAWIVRKDFAAKNPDFVNQFAKVTLKAYADYNANPKAWIANASNLDKVSRLTGARPEEIAGLLQGNGYPDAAEQADLLGTRTVKAVAATAAFLKEQGKVDRVQPDYTPWVEAKFARNAAH